MSLQPKTSPDPLPGDDWETRLTKQVARTVNHYRRATGLTTRMFAELCNIELRGNRDATWQEIKPTTLNNLFAGKRKSIGLGEIMLFARVLGVPPVALMTPVGVEDVSEAWPSGCRPAETVFDAIVGTQHWGSLFEEVTASIAAEGGQAALDDHSVSFEQARIPVVDRARRIAQLLLEHGQIKRNLMNKAVLFKATAQSLNEIDIDALSAAVRKLAVDLQSARERLRSENVNLVALRPMLSWIDVVDVADLAGSEIRDLVIRGADDAGDGFLFIEMELEHGETSHSAK